MRSQPGRPAHELEGRRGLPHQDTRMIWGSRRATFGCVHHPAPARSGGRAAPRTRRVPPASSITSDTHRMPAISGSCHSSKYTRGRSGHMVGELAHLVDLVVHVGDEGRAPPPRRPRRPPTSRMDWRISSIERGIGAEDGQAGPGSARRFMSAWEVGERQDQVGLEGEGIRSARKVVKPPTLGLSRASGGRWAVPGTPTTRSPAPSA